MALPECQQDNISTGFTLLSSSKWQFPTSHSCLQCHNHPYCPDHHKPAVPHTPLERTLLGLTWNLTEQTDSFRDGPKGKELNRAGSKAKDHTGSSWLGQRAPTSPYFWVSSREGLCQIHGDT